MEISYYLSAVAQEKDPSAIVKFNSMGAFLLFYNPRGCVTPECQDCYKIKVLGGTIPEAEKAINEIYQTQNRHTEKIEELTRELPQYVIFTKEGNVWFCAYRSLDFSEALLEFSKNVKAGIPVRLECKNNQ